MVVITGGTIEEIAESREITKRLRSVVDNDELWNRAWKYCKHLAKFSHAPVAISDYHRMKKYVDDKELISAILNVIDGYFPDKTNDLLSRFDIIGYSYCIALLSQTKENRSNILEYLNKLTDYVTENNVSFGVVLYRNMERLKKEFPDLADMEKKLNNNFGG